jgi:hypothetical protein
MATTSKKTKVKDKKKIEKASTSLILIFKGGEGDQRGARRRRRLDET